MLGSVALGSAWARKQNFALSILFFEGVPFGFSRSDATFSCEGGRPSSTQVRFFMISFVGLWLAPVSQEL